MITGIKEYDNLPSRIEWTDVDYLRYKFSYHTDNLNKLKARLDALVSNPELCPCGHIHEPSSNGKGLRTYCVEGSQCNSDKCKKFALSNKSEVEE